MNTTHHFDFQKTIVALAAMAACTLAFADDAQVQALTRPSSGVSVGVAATDGDQRERSIFGQYNGLRTNGTSLQLDIDVNQRDDASGTWLTLKGNHLGLDNRDLSVSYEKQGDWKLGADYSELVHRELRTINTGMQDAGTATPSIVRLATPGSGQDLNLKFKRVGMGVTAEKWLSNSLQLEVSLRNEDKTGARTFGIGYDCATYVCSGTQSASAQKWALLLLPEPVDSTTRQLEARLNYHADALNLSAGYYGSWFSNGLGNIKATVPNTLNSPLGAASTLFPAAAATVIAGGGTSLQNVLQSPVALAPDNQAHQFYVAGSYRFAPTAQATFKYAHTHATQNENFAAMGLVGAPAGVSSLGGVVNTNLVQLGLTVRPAPRFSVLANLRYEDKNDKTPEALYNIEGGTSTPATVPPYTNRAWYNYLASASKLVGKLEANYQLPSATRATLGLDYASHDRPVPVSITEEELAGLGAVRAKNQETGWRLELRRSMMESFSGAISYGQSARTGSDWTSLSTSAAFAAAGLGYGKTGSASQFLALSAGNAFPMNMADVDREKVKLSLNWMPSEQVELQLVADSGKDTNSMPFNAVALGKGWRQSSLSNVSLDANFAVHDNWKLNAYLSQGIQALKLNHSTGYMADLNTRTDGAGVGVTGKLSGQLEVGGRVTYVRDNTRYGLKASPTTTGTLPNITQVAPSTANQNQVAIGIPDVTFESTALSLFGKYAVQKNADIRVTLGLQRSKFNEWSWAYNGRSFVYQDNTSLGMNPSQSVHYVAVAYIYRFQ